MTAISPRFANLLLHRLPPGALAGLPLEPIALTSGMPLARANEPIEHVYFPADGICSIVAQTPAGQETESGLFGREGFGPTALALGVDRVPFNIFVQVPGEGHRVSVAEFAAHLERSPETARMLRQFTQVMNVQAASTALANAVHSVEQRLARWLLMCHDRVKGDELALTHEYLSLMLSVRRPSVTTALHVLEGHRYIHAQRGLITIRDRERLEEFTVDSYGVPEAEYRRLLGHMR